MFLHVNLLTLLKDNAMNKELRKGFHNLAFFKRVLDNISANRSEGEKI
jgi:hypothetical protein